MERPPDSRALPLRLARKVLVAIVGVAVVLVGVAGLVLPILPGWLLIFAGLAILATEFEMARRGLDAIRRKFRQAWERYR
jgi:uncharacterized protein (TIGR02611 family)